MADDTTRMAMDSNEFVDGTNKAIEVLQRLAGEFSKLERVQTSFNKSGDLTVKATYDLVDQNKKLALTYKQTAEGIEVETVALNADLKAKEKAAQATRDLAAAEAQYAREKKKVDAAIMTASNYSKNQVPMQDQYKKSIADAQGAIRDYVRQHKITKEEVARVWQGMSDSTIVYEKRLAGLKDRFNDLAIAQQRLRENSLSIAPLRAPIQGAAHTAGAPNITLDTLPGSKNIAASSLAMSEYNKKLFDSVNTTNALSTGQNNLGKSVKSTSEHVKNSVAQISKFSNIAMNMAERLVVFDIVGRTFFQISDYIRQSIPNFVQLTKAISEIQTISQQAQLSTDSWQKGIIQLSNAFGNTAADVAEASYQALSNQIVEGASTFAFMNEVLKLSKATVSDAATAQDALASVMNAYGKSVYDAEKISAVFFKTVDLGRVRLSDMSNTIGNLIVWGAELGVSFEEIAASIDTMTIRGVRYNVASTMMQNMFVKLIKPTKEMSKFLKEMGYNTAEAAVAGEGWYGILQKIGEKTKGSSTEMAKYFNTIRGLRGALFSTGEELQATLNALKLTQTDSLQDYRNAVEITMNSTATRYQQALTKIENYFTTTFGKNIVDLILNLDDTFEGLDKVVQKLIMSFGILGTVIGAGQVAKGINAMRTSMALAATEGAGMLAIKFAGLPGLIVTVIGAVTSLASAFFTLSLRNKEAGNQIDEYIKKLGEAGQIKFEQQKLESSLEKAVIETQTKAQLSNITRINAGYQSMLNDRLKGTQKNVNELNEIFTKSGKTFINTMEKEVKALDSIVSKLDSEIQKTESSIESINSKIAENKIKDYSDKLDLGASFQQKQLEGQISSQKASIEKYYGSRINESQQKLEEVKKALEIGEEELGRWEYESLQDRQKKLEANIAKDTDKRAKVLADLEIATQKKSQEIVTSRNREMLSTLYSFANQSEKRGMQLFDPQSIDRALQAVNDAKKIGDPRAITEAGRQLDYVLSKTDEARKNMSETVKNYEDAASLLKDMASKALDAGDYKQYNAYLKEYNKVLDTRDAVMEDQRDMEVSVNEAMRAAREEQNASVTELNNNLEMTKRIYDEIKGLLDGHKTSLEGIVTAWEDIVTLLTDVPASMKNNEMFKFAEKLSPYISAIKKDQESLTSLGTKQQEYLEYWNNRKKVMLELQDIQTSYYRSFSSESGSFMSGIKGIQEYSNTNPQAREFSAYYNSQAYLMGWKDPVVEKQIQEYRKLFDSFKGIDSPLDFITDPKLLDNLEAATKELLAQSGNLDGMDTMYRQILEKIGSARDYLSTIVTASGELVDLDAQRKDSSGKIMRNSSLDVVTKQIILGITNNLAVNNATMARDIESMMNNYKQIGVDSSIYAQAIKSVMESVPQLTQGTDSLNKSLANLSTSMLMTNAVFKTDLPTSVASNTNPALESIKTILDEINVKAIAFKTTIEGIRSSLPTLQIPTQTTIPDMFSQGFLEGGMNWPEFFNSSIFSGFAQGGKARGTDIIPAMLTPGEFVVKASQASKYYSLLHSINRGDEQAIVNNIFNGVVKPIVPMRYFAEGGSVSNSNTYGDFNVTVQHQNGELPFSTVLKIGRALEREVRKGTIKL